MTKKEISLIVERQREFFKTGETLCVEKRIKYLKKLHKVILEKEEQISDAIRADLGKGMFESYMCESGLVASEISYMIKHVRAYACEKTKPTPLVQFHSHSYVKPCPYGVVLIISPWNYPFLLTMDPLVDAIAAGNTCVIKPSAYSPNTSTIMAEIIEEVFPSRYVTVITGGREENKALFKEHFDKIFFTGSQAVGKEVLKCAAENLTPVTLELGGKSPCIVDQTANIKLAARRIVFGKYLNVGQTCVAPDYIYVYKGVKEKFIAEVKKEIIRQYGKEPLRNADYGKIINEKHFNRVSGLIDKKKVVHGGSVDSERLQIEPTVMENITWEDAVMQEEIFGPLMPILTFTSIDEVIKEVDSRQHPLALYIFSHNKANIKKITSRIGYGGGCINDAVIHLATSYIPFGGFGESGMGSYHGKYGFDCFSHTKAILDKKEWMDLPMRYQPYQDLYSKMLHMFLK